MRAHLEELMTTVENPYQSDFARKFFEAGAEQGIAEGMIKGKAEYVLMVLRARGVVVPGAARARILDCTDLEQLDAWIIRAVTIEKIDELFAP